MYATLTNRYTGRSTRVRLEPNAWVSVKNYRAALRRITATCGWDPVRSDVEFCTYDKYGPREVILQALDKVEA